MAKTKGGAKGASGGRSGEKSAPKNTEKESRRPNFTPAEREALLAAYNERKNIFQSTSVLPEFKRKLAKAWSQVAAAVNMVSRANRTPIELQRKLRNLKMEFKQTESQRKKEKRVTGGGTLETSQTLSSEENVLAQLVPSEMIEGIIPAGAEDNNPFEDLSEENAADNVDNNREDVDDANEYTVQISSDATAQTAVGIAKTACGIAKTAGETSKSDDLVAAGGKIESKKVSKKVQLSQSAAAYMQEEHEAKMALYREQLQVAKSEKKAAMAQQAYWEKKTVNEFYPGQEDIRFVYADDADVVGASID
jgi:hypothetical protein